MAEPSLASLLPAIDMAAFARTADGGFAPLAPNPPWFAPLADVTFPFLGHVLEEANDFWGSGVPGFREWGPCAEVDEVGVEFHYKVIAVTASGHQYLLFQLDAASDRMRETLQRVRDHRLALEQDGRTLATMTMEAHRAATELRDAVKSRAAATERSSENQWLTTLSSRTVDLVMRLDEIARALLLAGQP